jgi:outer membrane protein assembly factor BamA
MGVDWTQRFQQGRRFSASVDHEEVVFSSHTGLNRYGTDVWVFYRQPLMSRWSAGLQGEWEKQNERGVDVDGVPLIQSYAYQSFEVSPQLEWERNVFSSLGQSLVRLSLNFRTADYEDPVSTPTVQTQDYHQWGGGLRFQQELLSGQRAWVQYDVERRNYDKYIARLGGPASVEGDMDPNGSLRQQRDHHLTAAWDSRPNDGT